MIDIFMAYQTLFRCLLIYNIYIKIDHRKIMLHVYDVEKETHKADMPTFPISTSDEYNTREKHETRSTVHQMSHLSDYTSSSCYFLFQYHQKLV